MALLKHETAGHYIRRNEGSAVPRHIMVLDTETKVEVIEGEEHHKMKMAWSVFAYINAEGRVIVETWRYFNKRYALCSYVSSMAIQSRGMTLVGNNIFFDLQAMGFFRYLPEMGWNLSFMYENGITYILIIEREGVKIKCVSLTNYLEASVKDLGLMLGNLKMEVDFDCVLEEELMIYCFRDTEITFDALTKYIRFIKENDLGNMALTRASQSMKAYRHRFMKAKLLWHRDEEITALERAAYFGGRTECYRIGNIEGGPFIDLDVNSLYPYVMKENRMPVRVKDFYEGPEIQDVKDIPISFGIIAEVEIETSRPAYPFREGGKVLFPIGKFTTALCTDSLREALSTGEIRKVNKCALYDMEYIFSEYIDFFYSVRIKAREEGDAIVDRMAKLFMNSLYGKFAQQRDVEVLREECDSDKYMREEIYDRLTGETRTITQLFNVLVITEGREPVRGSMFSIPAHVTEYGRNMLWKIMSDTGLERVLYCDTDCIKIRKSDLQYVRHEINGGKIGALKIEREYESLTLNGPKDYSTEHERRIKGVPKTAEKITESIWEYKQFGRQLSHLLRGNVNDFIVKTVHKSLARIYTKGRVDKDGRVTPWVFPRDLSRVRALERSLPLSFPE